MASHSGIDVSTYQGDIDWARVKASGIEFAMLRASCGSGSIEMQTDSRFHKNAYDAAMAGLFIGAYHNLLASTAKEAHREAELFLKVIDGYRLAYPVAVDIEDYMLRNLSPEQLSMVAGTWYEDLKAAGYYPMIYGKAETLKNKMTEKALEIYEFWLSDPGESSSYSGKFGIRQNAVRERIPGIRGFVNRDEADQDYAALIYGGGYNGFSKQEPKPHSKSATEQPMPEASEHKESPEKSASEKTKIAKLTSKLTKFIKLKELFDYTQGTDEPDLTLETVTVKEGDTLVGIASRYGMTGRELYMYAGNREVIGVVPENMKPGMILSVPGKPKWPMPVLRVGAKVEYSGPIYRISYGWKPSSPVSGTYTLTRIVNGRKAGARLDKLGWVPISDLRIIS